MKHEPVKQKVSVKKGKREKSNSCEKKKYLLRRERQSETKACEKKVPVKKGKTE